MNSKSVLTTSLFVSLFLAGNIIIFGVAKSSFALVYFVFCILFFGVLVYSQRKNFENKSDIYFALFVALIVSLFILYTAITAFDYLDKKQEFLNQNQELKIQIENLTAANDYSINYIKYLNDQINTVKDGSRELQNKINDFLSAGAQNSLATREIEIGEHEREEDDD